MATDPKKIYEITLLISEYEGGAISVQRLNLQLGLSEIFGEYLAGGIIDKVGAMLLNRDVIVPAIDFPEYEDLDDVGALEDVDEYLHGGFIYLLEGVGTGWYKIGLTTKAPDHRVGQYSPKLPFETRIIHTFHADEPADAERDLHDAYAAFRTNGEWFTLPAHTVDFIKSIHGYENGSYAFNTEAKK